ncbi:MAG: hypothetical protein GXY83_08940 [Rhodopirellula sp.]|nr:hypothetical protein [Rhodopirellula sp.]
MSALLWREGVGLDLNASNLIQNRFEIECPHDVASLVVASRVHGFARRV